MAKLIFCVGAESVITDSNENKVSIINILERFNAPSFPTNFPLMYIICLWEKEGDGDENFSFKLDIEYVGTEETVSRDPVQVTIPEGKDKLRTILRLEGVPLRSEGKIHFSVKQEADGNWIEKMFYPVEVKQMAI